MSSVFLFYSCLKPDLNGQVFFFKKFSFFCKFAILAVPIKEVRGSQTDSNE